MPYNEVQYERDQENATIGQHLRDIAAAINEGRNGSVTIDGGNKGGKIYWKQHITMPPRFTAQDLDKDIQSFSSRFDRDVPRTLPKMKSFSPCQGYAGMDNEGFFLGCEINFQGDSKKVLVYYQGIAARFGYTVVDYTD